MTEQNRWQTQVKGSPIENDTSRRHCRWGIRIHGWNLRYLATRKWHDTQGVIMGFRTLVQVSDHFVVTGLVPTEPSGGERVAFVVGFVRPVADPRLLCRPKTIVNGLPFCAPSTHFSPSTLDISFQNAEGMSPQFGRGLPERGAGGPRKERRRGPVGLRRPSGVEVDIQDFKF